MCECTTLLFGLSGIRVQDVAAADRDGVLTGEVDEAVTRVVHVATDWAPAGRCPVCSVASTSLKQWRTTHPRDVEHGGAQVVVAWRKAQWRCRNELCRRKAFTESVP